jgi:hypothetical protein
VLPAGTSVNRIVQAVEVGEGGTGVLGGVGVFEGGAAVFVEVGMAVLDGIAVLVVVGVLVEVAVRGKDVAVDVASGVLVSVGPGVGEPEQGL